MNAINCSGGLTIVAEPLKREEHEVDFVLFMDYADIRREPGHGMAPLNN